MFSRFNRIPTSCDIIVCAMHTRHVLKSNTFFHNNSSVVTVALAVPASKCIRCFSSFCYR